MNKPTDSLIPLDQVLRQTGGSKSLTYAEIRNGTHPAPIKKGRSSLWSQNEINDYVEQVKLGPRGVSPCNVKNRAQLDAQRAT